MEYDPIKDKLFGITKNSVFLRDALFFAIGHTFLREGHVKRRIKLAQLPDNAAILDAGCGLGQYALWMAKKLPGSTIFAGDVKKHFIDAGNHHAAAKGLKNVTFGELDLLKLEQKNKYDFVLSIDVLEHIEDDVDLMKRFNHALKPGGQLMIHSPGAEEDSRTSHHDPKSLVEEHVREGYEKNEIIEKMTEAGFAKVDVYPTYKPFTGPLIWRLWQNIPLKFTKLGLLGYALIPLWFLLAYPLGYPFWWSDLHVPKKWGYGVLVVARKAS